MGVVLSFIAASSVATGPSADEQETLRQQFARGRALAEAGNHRAALDIFTSILERDPSARGSLLMSGLVHNQLMEFSTARTFLERFLALEPGHASGTMALVKALQSSGSAAEAQAAHARLLEIWTLGSDPRLATMVTFEREVREVPSIGVISIQEAFPGRADFTWKLLLLQPDRRGFSRVLEWKSATDEERTALGKDASAPLWLLGEPIYLNGTITDYKIRLLHSGALGYETAVDRAIDWLRHP